ncbi:MAG: hypothetical protein KA354_14285 [Phycisphaerae bacterium]|nr:hypothetical protein [Phycisphaerae bacterium]
MFRFLITTVVVAVVGPATWGAIVSTTTHGDAYLVGLEESVAAGDLLSGRIATIEDGDMGWHPVNTDPTDQLPAFTDDKVLIRADGHPYYGLLNDFPQNGQPVKRAVYDLGGPMNIDEIRIFTGNQDANGRIFCTVQLFASKNGTDFTPIGPNQGYYQSDPSGSINVLGSGANISGDPSKPYASTLLRIYDDTGSSLAKQATHLRFYLYGVDNTQGQMRDPFDGINTFTGVDDTLTRPNTSPLVWEIDALGFAGETCGNGIDDDNNGLTDCADLEACSDDPACRCTHHPVFDVDDDADVDQADFGVFQACYTGDGDLGGLFGSLSLDCQCMDLAGTGGATDNAIGSADLQVFMRCYTGPAMSALLDPNCDHAPF